MFRLFSILARATRLRPGKCFAHSWAKVSWLVSGSVWLPGAWLLLRRWTHGVRSRYRPGIGRKKNGGLIPPLAPVCLPALDPVINIAVLDHAVSPVTGYDDMIEDQYADPVEQALELKR